MFVGFKLIWSEIIEVEIVVQVGFRFCVAVHRGLNCIPKFRVICVLFWDVTLSVADINFWRLEIKTFEIRTLFVLFVKFG